MFKFCNLDQYYTYSLFVDWFALLIILLAIAFLLAFWDFLPDSGSDIVNVTSAFARVMSFKIHSNSWDWNCECKEFFETDIHSDKALYAVSWYKLQKKIVSIFQKYNYVSVIFIWNYIPFSPIATTIMAPLYTIHYQLWYLIWKTWAVWLIARMYNISKYVI